MKCFRTLIALVTWFAILACGGTTTGPEKGTTGTVLVADLPTGNYASAEMSIGFDSQQEFGKLKMLVPEPGGNNEVYIHGLVVADKRYPLGFYLDPSTTNIPANFAPELQHSMREITENVVSWQGQKVYVVLHVTVERYL